MPESTTTTETTATTTTTTDSASGAPAAPRLPPWLRGVCPVIEVPFHVGESLDTDGFVAVVDHVLATGVPSVMFPGYASEFHKLDETERSTLLGLLVEAADRTGVAVVAAVQDHATLIATRRAVQAVAAGASAINLLPPHLLGPSRLAVLQHVGAVLDAVPTTPVVVQYAPAQTGTTLDAGSISDLAAQHPNLVAVKVESAPPGRFIEALGRCDPSVPALVGYAGLQLPDALRRGAVGVQPGSSFVELYLAVWHLWQAGDTRAAEALHRRMVPFLSYWMQSVELIVAAEKLISNRRGLIATAACRAPAHELDAHEVRQVDRFLDEFAEELGRSEVTR